MVDKQESYVLVRQRCHRLWLAHTVKLNVVNTDPCCVCSADSAVSSIVDTYPPPPPPPSPQDQVGKNIHACFIVYSHTLASFIAMMTIPNNKS